MEVGIKETKEFINSLGMIAVAVKKISKDGIGIDDLSHIIALAKDMDMLLDGFKDLDKMKDELSSLDQAEVLAIISDLYAQAEKLNKA
jgi:hypothetical protein